jgi:Spy/CpxP family protein refolding chaperone
MLMIRIQKGLNMFRSTGLPDNNTGTYSVARSRLLSVAMGLLIAATVTVYATTPATADSAKRGAGFKPNMEALTERLALTEAQTAEVRTILEEQRDKRHALIQQYKAQGHEARELLRGEFQQLQEETNQRLATVLNAEQLQEFKTWSEERRQHMREHGGIRKHGRP